MCEMPRVFLVRSVDFRFSFSNALSLDSNSDFCFDKLLSVNAKIGSFCLYRLFVSCFKIFSSTPEPDVDDSKRRTRREELNLVKFVTTLF